MGQTNCVGVDFDFPGAGFIGAASFLIVRLMLHAVLWNSSGQIGQLSFLKCHDPTDRKSVV